MKQIKIKLILAITFTAMLFTLHSRNVSTAENGLFLINPPFSTTAKAGTNLIEIGKLQQANQIEIKVYNIRERAEFYMRDGNYLLIETVIEKGKLIVSEEYYQETETDGTYVSIHHYEGKAFSKNEGLLLNQKLFFGDESAETYVGKTKSFRTLNEELKDSLPGIWLPYQECEISYSWKGGEEQFTDDHSVIYFESEDDVSSAIEWALMTDKKPKIFSTEHLPPLEVDYEEEDYYYATKGIILFTHEETELVVTYKITEECGEEYYDEIQLFRATPDGEAFIADLEALPLMIFDADWDGDYDILYESYDLFDSHEFISIDYPSCFIENGDTIYICGC